MEHIVTTFGYTSLLKFTDQFSSLQQQPTTPSSMSTSDMSSLDDLDNLTDLLQMPSSQELTNFVTWDMDMADIKQESSSSPDRTVTSSSSCDQVTSDSNGNNCLDVTAAEFGVGSGVNCNGFEFGDINLDFVDNSLAGLIS